MSEHRLQCACGTLRGRVMLPTTTGRATCYCKDCRAFARWLGHPHDILNLKGGTDVVALMPSQVKIEQGLESLACMSLSPTGLYRWYASCCRTPIGNTPRDPKLHYLGLVHTIVAKPIEPAFGPSTVRVNTKSTGGAVEATPLRAMAMVARLMTSLLPARLTGRWRTNPLFDANSGKPVREPQVLAPDEAARLRQPA